MSGASPVSLERQGDIGVITVNYPPVNALGPGVAEGIKDCLGARQHRSRDPGDDPDRRRPQLHRRRRHPRLRHQASATAAGPACIRCAGRQREAGDRRDPRLRARRRVRNRDGLPLSHRAAQREGRAARSPDRHLARRRRHAAAASADRAEGSARHDRHRPPRAGAGGEEARHHR